MTRLLLTCVLCAGRALTAHSQGVSTWIEQLAALRTLEQTIQQGYTTMTHGLGNIGDIRYDEYQLHVAYYDGLSTVSPAVADDPKTTELTRLLQALTRRLNDDLRFWRSQTPIDKP